ncbi:MAG TPA: N-methyl-L-tryptophan oxidase [Acidobacteriaceae bacterium]|jgi:sarcosine oxidase|nr:N-methyl-L-tryptophan oxidase [Acidobacteriaceae bacterium]
MGFDVIVLGLGAMGSAAAHHLARRGQRVLAIDQFTSPHDKGSSHGGSRIIRQAYWEDPRYIPLVQRAYALWRALEQDAGIRLLEITGGLILGTPACDLVSRSLAAANLHAIPTETLDRHEVERRYPVFRLAPGDVGVFEPGAGYLMPESCIRAHLHGAAKNHADLHFDEPVIAWNPSAHGVTVRTTCATYEASHLVITAGPWASAVMPGRFPLRVTRQVMAWIQPRIGTASFAPGKFPIFLADHADGRPSYGFPAIDGPTGGIKTALHGSDEECSPESVDRTVRPADIERLLQKLTLRIPSLAGEIVQAQTCLYTMTPDEHFILGPHPDAPACTVACGFSGHGFKFSSVIGEILADLAITGSTPHPIALFSPQRFRP